jgi:hypothetical protein
LDNNTASVSSVIKTLLYFSHVVRNQRISQCRAEEKTVDGEEKEH